MKIYFLIMIFLCQMLLSCDPVKEEDKEKNPPVQREKIPIAGKLFMSADLSPQVGALFYFAEGGKGFYTMTTDAIGGYRKRNGEFYYLNLSGIPITWNEESGKVFIKGRPYKIVDSFSSGKEIEGLDILVLADYKDKNRAASNEEYYKSEFYTVANGAIKEYCDALVYLANLDDSEIDEDKIPSGMLFEKEVRKMNREIMKKVNALLGEEEYDEKKAGLDIFLDDVL